MPNDVDESSRSKASAVKLLYAAMKTLRNHGGELAGRDVMDQVSKTVSLSPWEKETFEKSGHIRWQSILHFYTINAVKAGFLRKIKGTWYLTPEGAKAIDLGDKALFDKAREGYLKWRKENPREIGDAGEPESDNENAAVTLSKVQEDAFAGFRAVIDKKNPYEFQDLVAALMRGMGYHVPVVAPPVMRSGLKLAS